MTLSPAVRAALERTRIANSEIKLLLLPGNELRKRIHATVVAEIVAAGSISEAARRLGVCRSSLQRMLKSINRRA